MADDCQITKLVIPKAVKKSAFRSLQKEFRPIRNNPINKFSELMDNQPSNQRMGTHNPFCTETYPNTKREFELIIQREFDELSSKQEIIQILSNESLKSSRNPSETFFTSNSISNFAESQEKRLRNTFPPVRTSNPFAKSLEDQIIPLPIINSRFLN